MTRRVRVELRGIPLHGWARINIERLCCRWGEVIHVDEGIMNPDKFCTPQSTIDTASFQWIQEWVILEIDGRRFDILIQEMEPRSDQSQSRPAAGLSQTRQERNLNFKNMGR